MNAASELYDLEVSLWVAETRGDRSYMETILAGDFIEFGRSGRRYTREETLAVPVGNAIDIVLPLPDFAVRMITDDVALVTYRSEIRSGEVAEIGNRASLWRCDSAGRWLLVFHQGTPTTR